MLVLDTNVLSDYLDGRDSARKFLRRHEDTPWAVPSVVLYDLYMGCVHGYIEAAPEELRQAILASMDVLAVTEQTASEAVSLQRELMDRGVPADHPDALIAAAAREHGGTFATTEKHFWQESVQSVLSVAAYDPH
ncbi:PIN domain-containing protein [Halovenus sp. WSH3]|uniref:PIN domain-containing protein n=1 Tax=Halovenus carboxidivorans TaxID=2692199 RepID=A0A6B0TB41_9EURY|nr:PIN domain-containing protein [Halovenus carboxidivorans]MXR50399.1 PIN domain-containing protein [Halovenus carboxidivorans]